jgi:PAS domain S-box-containing protein
MALLIRGPLMSESPPIVVTFQIVYRHSADKAGMFTNMMIGQETGALNHEVLEHQLRRAQQALHIAGIGTWDMDLRSRIFNWDDRCRQLHGFDQREISGYDEVLRVVHPQDVPGLRSALHDAIGNPANGQYDIRFRVLHEDGSLRHWLHGKGKIERDETGAPLRLTGTIQDITDLIEARQKATDAEQFAQLAIDAAGAGSFRLISATGEFIYSPTLKRLFTGTPDGILSHDAFMVHVHPEDVAIREQAHELALRTGQLFYEIRVVWEDKSVHWMRTSGTYEYDAAGTPLALSGIVEDITEYKTSRVAVEKSELLSRTVFENSPVAKIITIGNELRIEALNKRMLEIIGLDSRELIGRPIAEALPALESSNLLKLLRDVQYSGNLVEISEEGFENFNPALPGITHFQHRHSPLRNESGDIYGVISTWIDISREVTLREAEKKYRDALESSEARFRSLVEEAPIATCLLVGPEMRIEVANEMMQRAWGKNASVIGKPLAEAIPELVGQPFLDILDEVYRSGKPYVATADKALLEVDGVLETYYYNFTYKPLFDGQGNVYAIMNMAVDVTEAVNARLRLEEARTALVNAIDLAELGTWSLDISTGRIQVSDRMLSWFGLTAEEAMLGEAVDAIAEQDRDRVNAAILAASQPGAGIYSEEYTIVDKRTRQKRIIHAQGKAVVDENGIPLRLDGTARDISLEREVQTALEQLVQQRTEELAATNEELQSTNEELLVTNEELAEANERLIHSNEELAQYAYVASHDLQEPLRKIRVFSGMLNQSKDMQRGDLELLGKISNSAERMSLLIRDLLEFSRLLNSESTMTLVDLGDVATAIRNDFELRIQEKNALVTIDRLPTVEAVSLQMNQLFYNLIGNALKFIAAERRPEIRISAVPLSNAETAIYVSKPMHGVRYHKISFSDNGIGFEPQYNEQIFEVFKRLHGRDIYPGSGIGLALCRRIVNNHNGILYAESTPGAGSSFHIILPGRQG